MKYILHLLELINLYTNVDTVVNTFVGTIGITFVISYIKTYIGIYQCKNLCIYVFIYHCNRCKKQTYNCIYQGINNRNDIGYVTKTQNPFLRSMRLVLLPVYANSIVESVTSISVFFLFLFEAIL